MNILGIHIGHDSSAALEIGRKVLNTSFNIIGKPIVLDSKHAIRCFFGNGMDSLIIGYFIVDKET